MVVGLTSQKQSASVGILLPSVAQQMQKGLRQPSYGRQTSSYSARKDTRTPSKHQPTAASTLDNGPLLSVHSVNHR